MAPYTVSAHQTAVAFVFGYPLRAGSPTNPFNKILWIVRAGGTGPTIHAIVRAGGTGPTIHATPLHASRPIVTVRVDDSAGPETYPSRVNVPRAGCWHMTRRWAGRTDFIDLPYGPSCPVTPPRGPRPPRVALENFGQLIGSPAGPDWYGNGTLWTAVPLALPANLAALRTTGPDGVSMIGMKVNWNRARPGAVSVTARPLHGPPAQFIAHVGTVQQAARAGSFRATCSAEPAAGWSRRDSTTTRYLS